MAVVGPTEATNHFQNWNIWGGANHPRYSNYWNDFCMVLLLSFLSSSFLWKYIVAKGTWLSARDSEGSLSISSVLNSLCRRNVNFMLCHGYDSTFTWNKQLKRWRGRVTTHMQVAGCALTHQQQRLLVVKALCNGHQSMAVKYFPNSDSQGGLCESSFFFSHEGSDLSLMYLLQLRMERGSFSGLGGLAV